MNEKYPSSGTGIEDMEHDILIEMSRPDIYRTNAFRVLQLPVNASPREIRAHQREVDITEKLGRTQKNKGILPLDPLPDIYARREAAQRLDHPVLRFIDELFWFWPIDLNLPNDNDEALAAMKQYDLRKAVSIWESNGKKGNEAIASIHNLAIANHIFTLDLEYMAIKQPLSEEQIAQKRDLWKQVYPRWQVLLNCDEFWQHLTKRVRELNDPRIRSGTTRRIRMGLPFVLNSINAKLAVQETQSNNRDEVLFHVTLMRESGFDISVVDEAICQAVVPIRETINLICTKAGKAVDKAPQRANKIIDRIIDQTSQPLLALDNLLPEGNSIREAVHDKIALLIMSAQIDFGNKTHDWQSSLEILKRTLKIAASSSVRKQIKDNIKIVEGNLEYDTCWFCKRHGDTDKAALEVKMNGDVTRTPTYNGTHIAWRTLTVRVPRCSACKSIHNGDRKAGYLVGLAFGLLVFVIGMASGAVWFASLIFGGICFAIGYGIGFGISRSRSSIKGENYKNEFTEVKEKLSGGWSMGEKPAGVN